MLLQRLNESQRLNQLVSYLYLPYQLLQIAGYRLVGRQCEYQWGTYRPEPVTTTSRFQHAAALLLPPLVCCLVLALQIIVSLYLFARFYTPQNPWPVLFVLVQPIPFSLYGGWMILDLLRLRRLLKA